MQVSGTVDGVYHMGADSQNRSSILAEIESTARAKAVAAGAEPATCKVGHAGSLSTDLSLYTHSHV